tara:strand:+ start:527 stop:688 length:162 start_codon:yes stop_codon:yes gene_type:complete
VNGIWALEILASDPENRVAIFNASIIKPLNKLVKNGEDDEKIIATLFLRNLNG